MADTLSSCGHILLFPHALWGHCRPIIGFACKLVKIRSDIIVTVFVAGELQYLSEKEIDRHLRSEEDKPLKENIRLINFGGKGRSVFDLVGVLFANFEPLYTSLHSLEPVKCSSGRVFTYTRRPDVVVMDYFFLDFFNFIRKLSQVPVLCWNPTSISPLLYILGPESIGGAGDIEVRAKPIAEKTGKTMEEAELEAFHPQAGDLVKIPGLPPMYDYEYCPQVDNPHPIQVALHKKAYTFLLECNGMVCATSAAYEYEGCEAARAYFSGINKSFYAVGPLLPEDLLPGTLPTQERDLGELDVSPNGQEVIVFLDKMYAKFGSQSVIYASFGTLFWPHGEGIWKAVEVIFNMNIPLLLTYDEQRLGKMPEHIAKKFEVSDDALVTAWAPQHIILSHACTAWFITHGGYNSILEAILENVPMIGWPLSIDQPANVAHMSLNLNIAYEILEARSGPGLRPMYRGITPKGTLEALEAEIRDVLRKAFGEDGKRKRENVRRLKEKIEGGMKGGGSSFVDLRKFVEDYLIVG